MNPQTSIARLSQMTLHAVVALVLILVSWGASASPEAVVTNEDNRVSIAPFSRPYVDKTGKLTFSDIKPELLTPTNGFIPTYSASDKSIWLSFAAKNASSSHTLFLHIQYPNLSVVRLFKVRNGSLVAVDRQGNSQSPHYFEAFNPNIIFNLNLPPGAGEEFVLHVESEHPVTLPAYVTTNQSLHQATTLQAVIISMYMGILLVMLLYNLFLYVATNDKNYLLYTIYIFLLALAQLTLAGYTPRYLWPNNPAFNRYAVIWTSTLSAIAAVAFAMYFLQTRRFAPRIHKVFLLAIGIYVIGMLAPLINEFDVGYNILNYNGLLSAGSILFASVFIARRGFRPAYVFFIAWVALLVSFMVMVLRNLNVLPYNTFTAYIFYLGSAIEVALLAIALADKINLLRRETEASQAAALEASRENEKLVLEQNVMLERKVAERTEELQEANVQLSEAFKELKDAQIQLVESEKMASLGQLTAGIAHEINNPINFVKSNIKPLQLDFKDMVEVIDGYEKLHKMPAGDIDGHLHELEQLKTDVDLEFIKSEVSNLLIGIKEGAERTAEIVRGLRTFSRLDESQIKVVNIHEGIESTLVLLRNGCPDYVKIIFDFKAEGDIECFPGKLNQVFMNILSNAIQAIKSKGGRNPESITISTRDIEDHQIEIRIKDTGPGMSPEVKQKIFDPFFTTKDVGEGTGLGMAIVFKIIQEHSGKIEVVSAQGEGAEFIITLHHIVPEKPTL